MARTSAYSRATEREAGFDGLDDALRAVRRLFGGIEAGDERILGGGSGRPAPVLIDHQVAGGGEQPGTLAGRPECEQQVEVAPGSDKRLLEQVERQLGIAGPAQ